jgi:hypothetical protein
LIQELIQHSSSIPLPPILRVLRQVDTAEAARVMSRCYDSCPATSDHFAIAVSLAAMIDNEVTVSELQGMDDKELPRAAERRYQADHIVWPFEGVASPAFLKLMLTVRDDIAAGLKDGIVGGEMKTGGFRGKFPGIVAYLLQERTKLPREKWESMGFEVPTGVNSVILDRIHSDLRSGQNAIRESIRRLAANRSSTQGPSNVLRKLRWPCETLLALGVLLNGAFLGSVAASTFSEWRSGEVEGYQLAIGSLGAISVALWLSCIFVATRISVQGRRWLGRATPVGQILRRAPYLTRFRPWVNFAMLQLGWGLFSLPGVALIVFARSVDQGGVTNWKGVIGIAILPWIVFVLLCVLCSQY